jgi:hypothetical protein
VSQSGLGGFRRGGTDEPGGSWGFPKWSKWRAGLARRFSYDPDMTTKPYRILDFEVRNS